MNKSWSERNKAARMLRERLFRKSRPFVRPFDMEKDAWVLWAAYDLGSFPNMEKGMKPTQFMRVLASFVASKSSVLLIDDDTSINPTKAAFKGKVGPVAMVSVDNYGWRIEPQFDFFFWATRRMRLRAAVSFFQMIRHAKEVGVCVFRAAEKDVPFCDHLRSYELLLPCGKVPFGRPDGDDVLYYIKGRKGEKKMEERKAA
jgi:hypothetical protein